MPIHPDLFELSLSRSGTLLLDVFISNDSEHVPHPPDHANAAILKMGQSLRQIIPRIRQLKIFWDDSAITLQNFGVRYLEQEVFLSLSYLHITNIQSSTPSFTLKTPMLRRLHFESDSVRAMNITVSGNNLRDLYWKRRYLKSYDILLILSQFPHLERCTIESDANIGFVNENDLYISLPKLQSLSIKTLGLLDMVTLFERLEIPPSTNLALGMSNAWDLNPSENKLLGPLFASSDELRAVERNGKWVDYTLTSESGRRIELSVQLALYTLASYSGNLSLIDLHVQSLHPLPSLCKMLSSWSRMNHLGIHTDKQQFERLLAAFEYHSGVLCPSLVILDCQDTKFTSSRMARFLEFRKGQGLPLKELWFTKGFPDTDVEELRPLVKSLYELNSKPMS